jgi:hypothetical protein
VNLVRVLWLNQIDVVIYCANDSGVCESCEMENGDSGDKNKTKKEEKKNKRKRKKERKRKDGRTETD